MVWFFFRMRACARARVHINGHQLSTIFDWNMHLFRWNALVVLSNQFGHFNTNIFVVLTSHVHCKLFCCVLSLFRCVFAILFHIVKSIIMPIRLTALFHLVCNLHFVLFFSLSFCFVSPYCTASECMCILYADKYVAHATN